MSGQTDRFQVLRDLPRLVFEDELRGYKKSQVDRVLDALAPLADEVDTLQQRLSAAETRAASAEARLIERGSEAGADSARAVDEPEKVADAPVVESTPVPTADFDETLRNTLLLAQRTADQTVKEAKERAEQIRRDAQAEIDDLLADGRAEAETIQADNQQERDRLAAELKADREERLAEVRRRTDEQLSRIEAELNEAHASQRQELVEQIADLQGIRDLLADDVERFEAHLARRRDAVRTALAELSHVVEDNAALRGEMPPAPTSVEPLDPADYGAITVQSAAVDELELELAADEENYASGKDADEDEPEPDVEEEASTPIVGLLDGAGPDPDPVGPATELVDVLSLEAGDDDESDDDDDGLDDSASASNAESASNDVLTDHVNALADAEAAANVPDVLIGDDDHVGLADEPEQAEQTLSFDDDSHGAEGAESATAGRRASDAGTESGGVTNPWSSLDDSENADFVVERPEWVDSVPGDDDAPAGSADPFLDELRRATSDESDGDDDALARFLEDGDESEGRGGGWFGRRR